jgi:HAMP domain-containing protein
MSLRARIALLVAGVVIGAAIASVTAVRFAAESRFRSLVRESDQTRAASLAPVLADYFGEEGSWQGVESVIPSMPGMRGRMGGRGHMSEALPMAAAMAGSRILLVDQKGLVVADSGGALVGRRYTTQGDEEGVAVRTSAGVVGTVFVGTMVDRVLDPADSAFLASIARAILLAALGATAAAIAVGLAMAARIARPLRELTDAAERAAGGDLDVRVSARGGGEIGRLAGAFNRMASSLREHE